MCIFGPWESNKRGSELRIGGLRGFFKEMMSMCKHMNVDLKGVQEIARPAVVGRVF